MVLYHVINILQINIHLLEIKYLQSFNRNCLEFFLKNQFVCFKEIF